VLARIRVFRVFRGSSLRGLIDDVEIDPLRGHILLLFGE